LTCKIEFLPLRAHRQNIFAWLPRISRERWWRARSITLDLWYRIYGVTKTT